MWTKDGQAQRECLAHQYRMDWWCFRRRPPHELEGPAKVTGGSVRMKNHASTEYCAENGLYNVDITIINHPFGNGLYQLAVVIWGIHGNGLMIQQLSEHL